MPRPPRRVVVASLALAGGAACVPQAPDDQGRAIDSLYDFFTIAAAVVFVVTAGLIAWSIVRYRARRGDDSLPPQTRDNVRLEVVWFAIPQLLVVALFVASLNTLDTVNEQVGEPDVVVRVQGFQWGWRFTYEGPGVTVSGDHSDPPEIVLPVDRDVAFTLTTRDVIHAFALPDLLMKRDVIQGQDNRVDVTIRQPGIYAGKCAEFCGLLHARMNFTVRAVAPAEYERWLEEQGAEDGDG
ncbi:MAG TPA: cytochrome c oxidase subunit II [Actinomycetota bacterium]|nr:cytochrome c oxidase subunit II [Actinomycetota bacterium]